MNNEDPKYLEYQELVAGKNINPQTLLATDYLNHFNEIHMLLDMIADMPDCLDDILEWRAISYQEHFKYSVFQDKDLAIEAYDYSPERYKKPFEECVAEMDELLLSTIADAESAIKDEDFDTVRSLVGSYSPKMEKLIEQCSAIINSKETTTQQDVIDDFFQLGDENADGSAIDQSSIDDLFD